jgi:hypothetical protein
MTFNGRSLAPYQINATNQPRRLGIPVDDNTDDNIRLAAEPDLRTYAPWPRAPSRAMRCSATSLRSLPAIDG